MCQVHILSGYSSFSSYSYFLVPLYRKDSQQFSIQEEEGEGGGRKEEGEEEVDKEEKE